VNVIGGGKNVDRGEEQKLVKRIGKGDRQAFDRLVIEYQGRIYYTALRLLHNHEDALDATQDTFLKVWQQMHTLKKDAKVYSWLYRIAVNTCLDRLRWNKRHYTTPLTDEDVITIPEWRYETSPREMLREAMWKRRVEQALETLPARQKTIFVLRHFQNLKLREIAEILDRPLGTIKATLHHAIQSLREVLPQEDLLPMPEPAARGVRKAEDVR